MEKNSYLKTFGYEIKLSNSYFVLWKLKYFSTDFENSVHLKHKCWLSTVSKDKNYIARQIDKNPYYKESYIYCEFFYSSKVNQYVEEMIN